MDKKWTSHLVVSTESGLTVYKFKKEKRYDNLYDIFELGKDILTAIETGIIPYPGKKTEKQIENDNMTFNEWKKEHGATQTSYWAAQPKAGVMPQLGLTQGMNNVVFGVWRKNRKALEGSWQENQLYVRVDVEGTRTPPGPKNRGKIVSTQRTLQSLLGLTGSVYGCMRMKNKREEDTCTYTKRPYSHGQMMMHADCETMNKKCLLSHASNTLTQAVTTEQWNNVWPSLVNGKDGDADPPYRKKTTPKPRSPEALKPTKQNPTNPKPTKQKPKSPKPQATPKEAPRRSPRTPKSRFPKS